MPDQNRMDIFVVFVLVGFDLLAENKISRGPFTAPGARSRDITIYPAIVGF